MEGIPITLSTLAPGPGPAGLPERSSVGRGWRLRGTYSWAQGASLAGRCTGQGPELPPSQRGHRLIFLLFSSFSALHMARTMDTPFPSLTDT